MQHKVICPRDGCKNEAITDMTFGVLPCAWHQQEDEKTTISNSPRFWNLNKLHRIQREQDQHNGDTLQPWENGKDMKPNADFVKTYPEMAKEYFTDEELKRL